MGKPLRLATQERASSATLLIAPALRIVPPLTTKSNSWAEGTHAYKKQILAAQRTLSRRSRAQYPGLHDYINHPSYLPDSRESMQSRHTISPAHAHLRGPAGAPPPPSWLSVIVPHAALPASLQRASLTLCIARPIKILRDIDQVTPKGEEAVIWAFIAWRMPWFEMRKSPGSWSCRRDAQLRGR